jgi:hypothetical protein
MPQYLYDKQTLSTATLCSVWSRCIPHSCCITEISLTLYDVGSTVPWKYLTSVHAAVNIGPNQEYFLAYCVGMLGETLTGNGNLYLTVLSLVCNSLQLHP